MQNLRQIGNRLSLASTTLLLFAVIFVSSFAVYTYTRPTPPTVHAATTASTLNFQGRLLNANGSLVPDGFYNIQFNLYHVSSGGSTLWTETHDYNSNSPDRRVRVVNGYFSVLLGNYDSLADESDVNWQDDVWLGMTVRGSGTCSFAGCTPADSEMTPRFKLSAVPFALNSANVKSSNTNAASTNSDAITIQSGNATGSTSNSGNITLDVGTATQTAGSISIGTTNNTTAITIGKSTGTSATTINSGSGNITLQAQGASTIGIVQIGAGGAGSATPDFLALDVFTTGATDPAGGAEGYMYYNTIDNKFRCFVNSAWVDCDTNTGATLTLQGAYDNSSSPATIATTSVTKDIIFKSGIGFDDTNFFQIQNAAGSSLISADTVNLDVTISGNLLVSKSSQTNQDWYKISQSTAGTIAEDGGSTTAIDDARSSVVYNGSLYIGTAKSDAAEVYRYDGNNTWTVVNPAAGSIGGTTAVDSIRSLAVHNGLLYAGTEATENTGDGAIYRYDGGTTWTLVSFSAGQVVSGGTNNINRINKLVSFGTSLYAGTEEVDAAEVYRYDGGTTWVKVSNATAGSINGGTTTINTINSMTVNNNQLYISTNDPTLNNAEIYRYDGGTSWTEVSDGSASGRIAAAGTSNINGAVVISFNGSLYAGTLETNNAEVYVYNGGTSWTEVSNGGSNGQIAGGGTTSIDEADVLNVYNGNLYVGTLESNSAEIYRYNNTAGSWTKISQTTAGTIAAGGTSGIDEVYTMTSYAGSLYAGVGEAATAEVYRYSDNILEARASDTLGVFGIGASGNATLQNTSNSTTAFQIQNASGVTILNLDTINNRVSIGSIGVATSQFYIGGQVPSTATGTVSTAASANPNSVFVQGRYAYVANRNGNTLQIFDVSNPSSPLSVSTLSTGGGSNPYVVYVQGRYAYVINETSATLQIIDVSNPNSPSSVSTTSTTTTARGLYVQGRYAYVTTDGSPGTLRIFDISNPALPVSVGTASTGNGPYAVYVSGTYAYVVNSTSATLQVFNVSNPASPSSISTVATGAFPQSVHVQGRYAYVANFTASTLQIFDVKNPASMSSVGSVATGTNPRWVYVQGRYAYVANNFSNTLETVDVSNPTTPTSLGTVSTSGNPRSVHVQGRYAYVSNYTGDTLQIFDIGGSYIQQLETGGIETSTLSVLGNSSFNNDVNISGGLQVSRGLQVNGNLGASGQALFQNLSNSTTAFQIQNAAGSSALTVDTTALNSNVANPSFELDTTGWVANGTGASIARNTTEKYIGTASLAITTGTSVGGGARYTVGTALSTNTTYTLSFYAKAGTAFSTLSASYARSGAVATETDCAVFNPTRSVLTTGWTRYHCTINTDGTAPGSTAYIGIKQSDTTSRTLYIDGVQIEAGSAITQAQVSNTGFETGTTGWAYVGTPGSIAQSAVDKYNGTNSLLITTTANANNGAKFTTGNTNPTQLTVNTTYILSFWAKASGSSITNLSAAYAPSGATETNCVLNSNSISTSAWSYYTCNISLDGSSTPNASSYIIIKQSTAVAQTWYIDDVQLTSQSFISTGTGYRETVIHLNGAVQSPVLFKNQSDSTTAFQIQNSAGTSLLTADTINQRISVGNVGTATGQLYLGGLVTPNLVYSSSITFMTDLEIDGRYSYISDFTNNQLDIYDISIPSSPVNVGSVSTGTGPRQLIKNGKYVYVSSQDGTLGIFDVSNSVSPSLINNLNMTATTTNANDMYIQGRYLYVVFEGSNSFQIFDLANPINPTLVSNISLGSQSFGISVSGKYAYLVKHNSTVTVYDISNPTSPSVTGSASTENATSSFKLLGRYGYAMGSTDNVLKVIDFSNPASPSIVGRVTIGANVTSIDIQGRYIYAASDSGIQVVDISVPATPKIISQHSGFSNANTIKVQSRYAYILTNGTSSLIAYDLGGAYIQQLEAGEIDVNSLNVLGNSSLTGDVAITGGVQIGQGLQINGNLGASGQALFQNLSNSTTAFQIQNAAGSNALSVDTTGLNTIVSNSSFEAGTTGWVANGTGASIAQNTTEKYIGNASLAFTTGTAVGNSARLTVGTALSTSTTYTLSFYAKAGTAFSTLSASYSPDGTTANQTDCAIFNPSRSVLTTGWTRYYCTINTSSTAATASGFIAIKQSDTTSRVVYIDGLQIEAGTAITQGLVGNTGFEAGLTGWAYSTGVGTGTFTQNATPYNGAQSGRITITAGAIGAGARYTTGNTNPTQLASSSVYVLSFWAKASSGAITNLAAAYARDGTTQRDCGLTSNSVSTTDWAYYSCVIGTDGTAPAAGAYITIKESTAVNQTWDIDDVQITRQSFVSTGTGYRETAIQLNGAIQSPAVFKNQSDSTTAFQIQNSTGTALLTADTINSRISVGSTGTATGQLYISGLLPTSAIGTVATSNLPYMVKVQGNYAYVVNAGTTSNLNIYDVTRPNNPVNVGTLSLGTEGTGNIEVNGNYAYITGTTANNLSVIDISNPTAPTRVANVATIGTSPFGVDVVGRYAYVAQFGAAAEYMEIFDISNPTSPARVSATALVASSSPRQIVVQGNYAYIANFTGQMLIYNISNPASPSSVSTLTIPSSIKAIAVEGRYVYLTSQTTTSNELLVIDVANPASASIVGRIGLPSTNAGNGLFVQGRYAYTTSLDTFGIGVFDVSNPTAPTTVGTISNGATTRGVFVKGRYLYATAYSTDQLHIFDIGGIYSQSIEAGSIDTSSLSTDDLVVSGSANITNGLSVNGASQLYGQLGVAGQALFKNSSNSQTAFQVQNASGTQLLGVNTATSLINIGANAAPLSVSSTQSTSNVQTSNVTTTPDDGYDNAIAIGRDGLPVMSAYEFTNGNLMFVQCNTSTCSSMTQTDVDTTNDVGPYTDIAIAADGSPMISYFDNTGGVDLRFAKYVGTGGTGCATTAWNCVDVSTTGNVGMRTSIILDADGLPLISFIDDTNQKLKVVKCGNALCSSGNTETTIDDADDVNGTTTSMALGSDGKPVIAFYDGRAGVLNASVAKYVGSGGTGCNSTAWTCTDIDTTNDVGMWIALAISSDGFPIISYYDTTNADLRVTKCGNALCSSGNTTTAADTSATTVGEYTSVAVGRDGLAIISYYLNNAGADLKVGKCANLACTSFSATTAVDTTGGVGTWTSITHGTDGLPIISYRDETNDNLRVTRCGNTSCSGAGTTLTAGLQLGSVNGGFQNVYTQSIRTGNSGDTFTLSTGEVDRLTINGSGEVTFKNTSSTNAFQIQNAAGMSVLRVDTTETAVNLVTNNNFESNTTGWSSKGTATNNWVTTNSLSGTGSIEVIPTAVNSGTRNTAFALTANTTYNFSAYVKTKTGSTNTIVLGRQDDNATDTDCAITATVTSNGWTLLECTFTTGTSITGGGNIYIKQTDATTRTWYVDAVNFAKASELSNPGIEAVITGNWTTKGTTPAVTRDTTNFYSGTAGLSVVTQATANQGTRQDITLQTSTSYTLSFWAKTSFASAAFATMEAGYSSDGSTDNTACMTVQTVSQAWVFYRCTFTTPATTSGTPYVYIKQTDAVIHTYYLDDIQLTKGNPLTQYRESSLQLNGIITSQLLMQNTQDSTNAFSIKNALGTSLVNIDTLNSLTTFNSDIKIGKRTDSGGTSVDWTKISQSSAGTIAASGTANIDYAYTSAVYNGSLYIGTLESNAAEVYRYNGGSSWTKVSQATAGTIASGGTASIDGVTSMTVYNGKLYIGTFETNAAEVYRYDGGTTWTKVSQATAGTIAASGTAAIDGIYSMAINQDKLYIGTNESGAAEVYRYDDVTTWTKVSQATAGTIAAAGQAGIDTVNSMVSYGGYLHIGTNDSTAIAQVYRYDGGTTWTQVSSAAGTIASGGTSAILGVTALTVHGGSMYAGTNKSGQAEVYKYTFTQGWTKVSQATAGTIAASGTTAIDGILSLQSYNGNLYTGTLKGTGSSEFYRLDEGITWTKLSQTTAGQVAPSGTTSITGIYSMAISNDGSLYVLSSKILSAGAEVYTFKSREGASYALRFGASSDNTNAEQNGFFNEGSINFTAELQSGNNYIGGNTGSFQFSHGITTAFGAYDVAEDYPTREEDLLPGSLVSIDPNEVGFVRRTQVKEDSTILGIYSEKPGLRLSQQGGTINGARAVPIALAGRVPVNVSNENGPIMPGDYLTSSSIPGYAAKAIGPGPTVGKALESFVGDSTNTTGKVQTFLNISYYVPQVDYQGANTTSLINLLVSGSASVGSLNASGPTTLTTLTVSGNAVFAANISVAGEIILSSNLVFNGNPNEASNAITQKYKAGEDLTAGDTVVLDALKVDGSVVKANSIADTKVIGVVMEDALAGASVKVAVGGRVEVKVPSTALIITGDLITTDLSGTANKLTVPSPGAVLGKATSQKSINNRIWIQLTLQ